MYGQAAATASQALQVGIAVDPVPERVGQILTMELEDQLNPSGVVPANPRYRLHASLRISESGIGNARDGTVSRFNVYLDSIYTLYRISDGQRMTDGRLRHVSSYNNIVNEYYSTYVAQQDAYKRGLTELARIYQMRLSSYLSQNNGNPPIEKESEKQKDGFGKDNALPIPENPASQNSITPTLQAYP